MLFVPATAEILDPRVAEIIARAEVHLAMVERLAVIGMVLAEEIGKNAPQASLHPEPRHDPARSFAFVSRAVRLTLAFSGRIDADILAMRKGEPTSLSRPTGRPKPAADKPVTYPSTLALGPEGVRVRDAVGSAIEAEHRRFDGAMGALDELHERLVDYERQEGFLSRPWRECVDAICADLGLQPDWSRWSDDKGFIGPVGKPAVKWTMMWNYDPKRSELRRRQKTEAAPDHPPDPHSRQLDAMLPSPLAGEGVGAADG